MANITFADVREKYPQYKDIPDQELADKLHAKYYSDMPKEDFYSKIGFKADEKPFLQKGRNSILDAQDIAGGIMGTMQKAASGLGEAGQYIGDTMAKKLYKEMTGKELNIPKVNIREEMGLEGDNQVDLNKLISKNPNGVGSMIGSIIPYAAGTPAGKLAGAAGAGAMTGLTSAPDEKLLSSHIPGVGDMVPQGRLPAAIESSLLSLIAPVVAKKGMQGIIGAKNIVSDALNAKNMAKNIESHLNDETHRLKEAADRQIDYVKKQTENHVNDINQDVSDKAIETSQNLGKRNKTLPQVSESIANDVRQLHDAREANASSYFKHVLDQVNATPDKGLLYKKADPLISTALDEGKGLMSKVEDLNVGEPYEKFKASPTFENAHMLRQELGIMLGDLKKMPMRTPAERLELANLKNAYAQLGDDMQNYLTTKFPDKNVDLAGKWKQGQEIYKETVAPYLSNEKLREITRGRKRYVENIHEAFANPTAEDQITRDIDKATGKPMVIPGAGSKILNDLSQDTKDKIMFSKIGAKNGAEPNKLINAVDQAKVNGFEHYESPNLRANLNHMLQKQQEAEALTKASKQHVDELKYKVNRKIAEMERETKPVIDEYKEKARTTRRLGRSILSHTIGYNLGNMLSHKL
jgi:hypothetical protein